ncbi:MAG: DUF4337 family protein [Gluconacetobacter diazotrophicus]|nr:DUF4337 family protein [Gluconacetobacter diazotrophicus]
MDNVEMAQSSLEHGHAHGHAGNHQGGQPETLTRAAAVLVAGLAAVAVVVEMSANDQQTAYLAHDVAASDLWSQYQGKSVRRTVSQDTAAILDAEPAASDRSRAAADAARAAAVRLENDPGGDGMRQLSGRATAEEHLRDHALHLHEHLERGVRGLQIAIVLVGLFMATRLRWLLGIGGALGVLSLLYSVLAGLGGL